jgi:hypothetical protein
LEIEDLSESLKNNERSRLTDLLAELKISEPTGLPNYLKTREELGLEETKVIDEKDNLENVIRPNIQSKAGYSR